MLSRPFLPGALKYPSIIYDSDKKGPGGGLSTCIFNKLLGDSI